MPTGDLGDKLASTFRRLNKDSLVMDSTWWRIGGCCRLFRYKEKAIETQILHEKRPHYQEYGRLSVWDKEAKRSRSFYAHRVAYWLKHGDPGEGVEIHHQCGYAACINPLHLKAKKTRKRKRGKEGK